MSGILKKAELILSQWWPKADFNELKIVCFLAIWLFLWDDELDEPTGEHADNFASAQKYREETLVFLERSLRLSVSTQTSSHPVTESMKNIGQQVKLTYEACLGLLLFRKDPVAVAYRVAHSLYTIAQQVRVAVVGSLGFNKPQLDPPKASHPIIESFRPIGEALAAAYTIGKLLFP